MTDFDDDYDDEDDLDLSTLPDDELVIVVIIEISH
jgi:hypothetical protein